MNVFRKHTKILDPSSLIPLDKKVVVVVIILGWLVILGGLFTYKSWGKRGGSRIGLAADDQDDYGFGVSRPLLLNIPNNNNKGDLYGGMDPYIATSR
jgi:hypothetical protein